jgi:tetratricopeptide (TPR) repeat protein
MAIQRGGIMQTRPGRSCERCEASVSRILTMLLFLLMGANLAKADVRGDCRRSKDREAKIAACSEIISSDPRAAWAYNNRGNAYSEGGDRARAISDYSKAIEITPSFPLAYYNRCDEYKAIGEQDLAIADCAPAIQLDPEDPDAYIVRGDAYRDKHELDQALADYHRAIEIDPNNTLHPARPCLQR